MPQRDYRHLFFQVGVLVHPFPDRCVHACRWSPDAMIQLLRTSPPLLNFARMKISLGDRYRTEAGEKLVAPPPRGEPSFSTRAKTELGGAALETKGSACSAGMGAHTSIVLEADRRLHQIISQAPKNMGTRNQLAGGVKSTPPVNPPKTLADLGLDKNDAKEIRAVGTLSEAKAALASSRQWLPGNCRLAPARHAC